MICSKTETKSMSILALLWLFYHRNLRGLPKISWIAILRIYLIDNISERWADLFKLDFFIEPHIEE